MLQQKIIDKGITRLQRKAIRRMPMRLLIEAFKQLQEGRDEHIICSFLGVNSAMFSGAIRWAIVEALWERGYFSFGDMSLPTEYN